MGKAYTDSRPRNNVKELAERVEKLTQSTHQGARSCEKKSGTRRSRPLLFNDSTPALFAGSAQRNALRTARRVVREVDSTGT